MMKIDFFDRLASAIVESDIATDGKGKYLVVSNRIKVLDDMTYTEDDLRGLSKIEKQFMRYNNMRSYIDSGITKKTRYYIFISKDLTTGKKRIYALSKKQIINPNGHDISNDGHNYECWLTFKRSTWYNPFSVHYYEYRFCTIAPYVCMGSL